MKYEEIPLQYNEDASSFELIVDGFRSFINFKQKGDVVYMMHTEVAKELEGKGVAAVLVEKAFNYLEENNLKLVAACTYIRVFLKRNPEWNRLL